MNLFSATPVAEQHKAEILKHLCLGQNNLIMLYFYPFENDVLTDLFSSLIKMQPPSVYKPVKYVQSPKIYLSNVDIYLSYLTDTKLQIDSQSIYFFHVKNSGTTGYDVLSDVIENPSKLNQNNQKLVIKALTSMFENNSPLFRTIQSYINKSFQVLDLNELIQNFGVLLFHMKDEIDPKFIVSFPSSIINHNNISYVWGSPSLLLNVKTATLYQQLLVAQCSFPHSSELFEQNNVFT